MQLVHDPYLNLRGDLIALGPLRRDLVPLFHRWMNDFAVSRTAMSEVMPVIEEGAQDYYDAHTRFGHGMEFVIYLPVDGDTQTAHQWRPIGLTGLRDVNQSNRSAEFSIIIAERDTWNHGYGTEATRLVIDYGFNVVTLHNINLLCYATNTAAITAYERAGFKHVGVMHDCCWVDGRRDDMVIMDAIATEFGPSRVLPQMARPQPR